MTISTVDERKAFAERLILACDRCPDIPALGYGRQGAIAEVIGVAREGVHAWLNGLAMPNNTNVVRLADLLGVDPGWLFFGGPHKRIATPAPGVDYAALLVRSLFELSGITTYDPAVNASARAQTHFFVNTGERLQGVHVALGTPAGGGAFEFIVPRVHRHLRVMGLMQRRALRPTLLDIEPQRIDDNGKGAGAGKLAVWVTPEDGGYFAFRDDHLTHPLSNLEAARYS